MKGFVMVALFCSPALAQEPLPTLINPKPGTIITRIGNGSYRSDGSSVQRIGNMYIKTPSGQSSFIPKGNNTQYNSDGSTAHRIGNAVYHSNGVVCQTIGTITTCN